MVITMSLDKMMELFVLNVKRRKLLSKLVCLLCGNANFRDYNYIFRMKRENNKIIIDICENVTDVRFHRFIYCFSYGIHKDEFIDSVNVKTIYVLNNSVILDNSVMFGVLFSYDKEHMLLYGKKILRSELYDILVYVSEF